MPCGQLGSVCIDAAIKAPISTTDHLLNALHKPIDVGRLWNLSSLTLHIRSGWGGFESRKLPLMSF
jgi:hypothetical protein